MHRKSHIFAAALAEALVVPGIAVAQKVTFMTGQQGG